MLIVELGNRDGCVGNSYVGCGGGGGDCGGTGSKTLTLVAKAVYRSGDMFHAEHNFRFRIAHVLEQVKG